MSPPVYVVTLDVERRLNQAGFPVTATQLQPLRERFLRQLQDHVPGELIVYDESDYRRRMNALADKLRPHGQLVSMTDDYVDDADDYLELNRAGYPVNGHITKMDIPVARHGSPPASAQFDTAAARANGRPIILVDDGVWSGGTLNYVITQFQQRGCPVVLVGGGIIRSPHVPTNIDQILHSLFPFPDDQGRELADWICERDFTVIVPNFGRQLATPDLSALDHRRIGMAYFGPTGFPYDCASIEPPHQKPYSTICIEFNLDLLTLLEGLRGNGMMQLGELTTKPWGLQDRADDLSVREFLHEWGNAL